MTTKVEPTVDKCVQELIQIVCDSMIERLGLEPDGHRTWATTTDEIVEELSEELYEQLPHSVQEAKAEERERTKAIVIQHCKYTKRGPIISGANLDDLLSTLTTKEGK